MIFTIKKYQESDFETWDNFINSGGIYGTIYHTRKFINYHPINRFEDESIMIYHDNLLVCVMPCCKKNENFFSYTGATYGGPVFHKKYTSIKYMKIIIDTIFTHFNNKLQMRIANPIYFEENISKLYYLLSTKLTMKPELSWYINTNTDFISNIKNKDNKRVFKKMINNTNIRCYYTNNDSDYIQFHNILVENLRKTHNTIPTHTKDELLSLKTILNEKQSLYVVKNEHNIMLGGVYLIKVTKSCWYIMYMSKNIKYPLSNSSVIYSLFEINNDAKRENVEYIDYGICTENHGKEINCGLAEYKESSLGGLSSSRYVFT